MANRLQTRADYRNAGRMLARQVSEPIGALIAEVSFSEPEKLTDAYVDGIAKAIHERLEAEMVALWAAGARVRHVRKFEQAFLLEAHQQFRALQLAALPAAGNA